MNPLTLSIIGLYKTAVIRRRGSRRTYTGHGVDGSTQPVPWSLAASSGQHHARVLTGVQAGQQRGHAGRHVVSRDDGAVHVRGVVVDQDRHGIGLEKRAGPRPGAPDIYEEGFDFGFLVSGRFYPQSSLLLLVSLTTCSLTTCMGMRFDRISSGGGMRFDRIGAVGGYAF